MVRVDFVLKKSVVTVVRSVLPEKVVPSLIVILCCAIESGENYAHID